MLYKYIYTYALNYYELLMHVYSMYVYIHIQIHTHLDMLYCFDSFWIRERRVQAHAPPHVSCGSIESHCLYSCTSVDFQTSLHPTDSGFDSGFVRSQMKSEVAPWSP